MAFQRMTDNVLNVSALPNVIAGQASTLKSTFDKSGLDLKNFINNFLTSLESSTASESIGADVQSVATKTLAAVLTSFEESIANRYTKTEAETLLLEGTNNLISDIDVNLTTGVITITKKGGTTETFDTALEKVPANFEIVNSNGIYYLKITNVDGSSTQTDITNLMNIYNFSDSETISFEVVGEGNEKTVTASIKANSIGLDKLSLTVVSTLEGYANSAKDSANAAKASETIVTAKADEVETNTESVSMMTQTVGELYNTITGSANTAVDSANASKTSETNAKTSEINAKESETNAKTSETNAKTSETNAKASATEAQMWAQQAGEIPKFIGTEETPIDFSDLFSGIDTANRYAGYCIIGGYFKTTDWDYNDLGVKHWKSIFPSSVSTVLNSVDSILATYKYTKSSNSEYGEIEFNTVIGGNIYTLYGIAELGLIDEFDSGLIATSEDLKGYYNKTETDDKITQAIANIDIPNANKIINVIGEYYYSPIDFHEFLDISGTEGICIIGGWTNFKDGETNDVSTLTDILYGTSGKTRNYIAQWYKANENMFMISFIDTSQRDGIYHHTLDIYPSEGYLDVSMINTNKLVTE